MYTVIPRETPNRIAKGNLTNELMWEEGLIHFINWRATARRKKRKIEQVRQAEHKW